MKPSLWSRLLNELFRIRTRLLLVNVLIVSVPLVGIGFARFYEGEMLRALEDDMVHQAQVVSALWSSSETPVALQTMEGALVQAARHTRTRLRLLDEKGQLVADSHRQGPPEGAEVSPSYISERRAVERLPSAPDEADAFASRVEVKQALQGRYGSTTRIWRWSGGVRVYMFAALPLLSPSGHVVGVVYVTRSTLPVLAALYRLRTTLFKILLAAVVVTAILSIFLASTIARPLGRLSRLAQRVAQGDRHVRLGSDRRDELGHLARTLESMARRLDQRAQQSEQLAADISHEFKSPLTSIRGAAELLLDGASDDLVARARFLQNILADAGRLDRLVSRLLELSRWEADEAPLQTVDLKALTNEVAESAGQGLSVAVRVHSLSESVMVRGRPAALASAVRNLIENACQHSPEEASVGVFVEVGQDNAVQLRVVNQGPVISEANLARVWDRFFSTRPASGGSGLGLPIVASVATSHGGYVFARSTAQETTFGFVIPG